MAINDPVVVSIGGVIMIGCWLAFALFSDTRHNHGLPVALLLPLAPVLIPLLWLTYKLVHYSTLLVFVLRGRADAHAAFMHRLKLRSGVFLIFD